MKVARDFLEATVASVPSLCAVTLWPINGIVTLPDGRGTLSISQPVVYEAPCHGIGMSTLATRQDDSSLGLNEDPSSPQISNFRDPFYASTFPMCYALAATTVTAWMLVVMLFVTPRSFLDGGVVRLSRRSFTNSSSGGISIGGRPWLQKIAALTVAISLTVATEDTFQYAGLQYTWGILNAKVLQDHVMGGKELKAIRLVSDTFLWLAQAQTLIRLFPRQKEKVIIKWAAFLLITLDLIFSSLNSFLYSDNGVTSNGTSGSFGHPIPTLSYLFQLSLGLLYAAWVIYYAFMKRRYSFYHPLMKNICLVALISLISIFIPVVFFILDISQPRFTAWGDYVRWVGAAAASVVVWEWVERIEALEREEKKDGILGREVFNDDDMLEVDASEYPSIRKRKNGRSDSGSTGSGHGGGSLDTGDRPQGNPISNSGWPAMAAVVHRHHGQGDNQETSHDHYAGIMGEILRPPIWPTRPTPVITTPVSRTDTASAASTVYAVRYQGASEATRTPDPPNPASLPDLSRQSSMPRSYHGSEDAASVGPVPGADQNGHAIAPASGRVVDLEANRGTPSRRAWTHASQSAPSRTSEDDAAAEGTRGHNTHRTGQIEVGRWDLRARLELFAANQADRMRERLRPTPDTNSLPVTFIPAPARRGAALQQVLEEEEMSNDASPAALHPNDSPGGTSGSGVGEMTQLVRTAGGQEVPLPANNPPLWPGVQSRQAYDDDDEYSYEDYSSEVGAVSTTGSRGGSEQGPSRGT